MTKEKVLFIKLSKEEREVLGRAHDILTEVMLAGCSDTNEPLLTMFENEDIELIGGIEGACRLITPDRFVSGKVTQDYEDEEPWEEVYYDEDEDEDDDDEYDDDEDDEDDEEDEDEPLPF